MSISSASSQLEQLFFSSKKRFLGTLAGLVMLLAIPVTMSLVFQQQDIRQRAECYMNADLLHCGPDLSRVYVTNHITCLDDSVPCTPAGSTCEPVITASNAKARCVGGTTPPTATTAPASCTPITCQQYGTTCGTALGNGCGGTINCPCPTAAQTATPNPACAPGSTYCALNGGASACTLFNMVNCVGCLYGAVSCTPVATATPTTTGCAPFSQWNTGGTSYDWGPLRGTSICIATVTSWFRTCLNYSYDPITTIQMICTTPTVTAAPVATVAPTATGAPTATPTLGAGITLSFSIILPGIGSTSALGLNTNPARTPSFTVQVGTATIPTTSLTFNSGLFTGNVNLPNITPGAYAIKIKSDNSLYKAVPGTTMTLTNGGNVVPQMTLVTGNVNDTSASQNKIDLQDYNYLISCYNGIPCNTTIKADLNLDGTVDSKDLNILLRAFATPTGD